jgi:hypothetical protein
MVYNEGGKQGGRFKEDLFVIDLALKLDFHSRNNLSEQVLYM